MNFRSLSLWACWALVTNSVALGASNVAAPSAATTNAPAVIIPKSIFVLPTNPDEGKDPFFPRSMRPYGSIVIKTNPPPTIVAPGPAPTPTVDLHLDGISGTSDHRLAIINYHTFEVGEEADVVSGTTRAHVRCLEIKADSVIVLVAGERRILRLRSGL